MQRWVLLTTVAALVSVGIAAAAPKPSISIVGVSQVNGVVTVSVKIVGWKMYPKLVGKKRRSADGGHWHIFVDGRYNGFSASRTLGRTTKLAAGAHTIRVELAHNDHSLLRPAVRSRAVRVDVAAPPEGEPPPEDPGGDYGY